MAPTTKLTAKSSAKPNATPRRRPSPRTPEVEARRRQVRGLLLLAVAVITFSILRAGMHRVFTTGWWHLW